MLVLCIFCMFFQSFFTFSEFFISYFSFFLVFFKKLQAPEFFRQPCNASKISDHPERLYH